MKSVGIMQPYFFPYLGYFDLIYNSDQWIVFDDIQYIRHGWVNRNRILHPSSGWQYVIVPLKKHSRESKINEIEVDASDTWKKRILGQIEHYRKKAPFYNNTVTFLSDCFDTVETSLTRLNVHFLKCACDYLDIRLDYKVFSEMNLQIGPISDPGDWAFEISRSLGAEIYINPPGGQDLFDPNKFQEHGIQLMIREFPTFVYPSPGYTFEPNLSIIDVLMWNTPEQVRDYLDRVKLPDNG